VTKYEKTCFHNQHVCIPFAFDIFGFLAPKAVSLLQRVQKIMNNNIVTSIAMNLFLKELILPFKKIFCFSFLLRPFKKISIKRQGESCL
jgi:hypothetical protein